MADRIFDPRDNRDRSDRGLSFVTPCIYRDGIVSIFRGGVPLSGHACCAFNAPANKERKDAVPPRNAGRGGIPVCGGRRTKVGLSSQSAMRRDDSVSRYDSATIVVRPRPLLFYDTLSLDILVKLTASAAISNERAVATFLGTPGEFSPRRERRADV